MRSIIHLLARLREGALNFSEFLMSSKDPIIFAIVLALDSIGMQGKLKVRGR
jgi:hypothetical protein